MSEFTELQGLGILLAIILAGTFLMWLILPDNNTHNICAGHTDRTAYENCLDSY